MTKRAFIYLRVSTDEQAAHGYGLDGQRRQCLEYAERNHFEVVEIFSDDISGKIHLPERPQGALMHARLMHREVNAVIVARVDRLSRKSVNGQLIAEEWLARGIELHFADIGQVTDSNNIVFVINSWKGHEDHTDIVKKLREGRYDKVQRGKVLGGGKPPYGYNYAFEILPSGRNRVIGLAINENEAPVVRQIFQLYLSGLSLRALAAKLNAEHAPLPSLTRPSGKPRLRASNLGWSPQTVRRILQSETYCGVWTYYKRLKNFTGGGPKFRATETKEQVSIRDPKIVPPIVTREMIELAAARCEYNVQFARRNRKNNFLLTGLARCGCGYSLRGNTAKDTKGNFMYYYWCGQMPKQCGAKRIRAAILEAIAWQFILDVFEDEDSYRALLEKAAAQQEDTRASKRADRQTLIEQMAATERQAIQLAISINQIGDSGIVTEHLQLQARQTNARYADQKERLAVLEQELAEGALTPHKVESLLEFRRQVALGLEDPTEETKQGLFRDLQMVATLHPEIVHIKTLVGECEYRLISNGKRKARVTSFESHSLLRVWYNITIPCPKFGAPERTSFEIGSYDIAK